ncbi:helix-turn-helix domain-containing protein [Fusibacter paucivorans]|uniref:Helix-turn-helix domain-containing protein n=1 Tax=Fusibacter paucivorans TaxID=76009 RepID=A0ABS5PTN4_9FIRM|nr:helix-turn-helix domain-containing protein [Fusibacter paucivorans]MBS7528533.1 helix-turn-helix domain-containing protein [Fusibacter paucivorans]
MSNKSLLIECVYSLKLTQRATLVAFYLINRADSEGTCFPGVKTIARECNISSRTVQRALNDLEEVGFLARESRFHEQGGQRSNLYYLQVIEVEQDEEALEEENKFENTAVDNESIDKEEMQGDIVREQISPKMDIEAINFNDLCDSCVSRSPCQECIP